jgi:hypothetical protein
LAGANESLEAARSVIIQHLASPAWQSLVPDPALGALKSGDHSIVRLEDLDMPFKDSFSGCAAHPLDIIKRDLEVYDPANDDELLSR